MRERNTQDRIFIDLTFIKPEKIIEPRKCIIAYLGIGKLKLVVVIFPVHFQSQKHAIFCERSC